MAAGDRYSLEIGSMKALIAQWRAGAEEIGALARRLAAVHDQMRHSIPARLVEGLLAEVPLAECLTRLADATRTAVTVSQGLTQDTSTLGQNLSGYLRAEQEAQARLDGVRPGEQTGGGGGRGPGGAGDGGPPPPGGARYATRKQIEQWIGQAFRILAAQGVPPGDLDEAGVLLIIEHESSGDPRAVNEWDDNARAGDPSRGLMQVIGATFEQYKLPGHDDVFEPVDNIIAGVRYALARYGSIRNVPGVRNVENGGPYVGY